MSPELPPPQDHEHEPRPRGDPRFGPEAQAVLGHALGALRDPDAALRLLGHVEKYGSGFAAYLTLLPDSRLGDDTLEDTFNDLYVDAWEHFAEFRRDILDGLGWLAAVNITIDVYGIPEDHLIWNHAAIDERILDTYNAVHLDGWWHIFNK